MENLWLFNACFPPEASSDFFIVRLQTIVRNYLCQVLFRIKIHPQERTFFGGHKGFFGYFSETIHSDDKEISVWWVCFKDSHHNW